MTDARRKAKSHNSGLTQSEPSPERLLVEAERRIKKLEAKILEQRETIRGLRSEARDFASFRAKIAELKEDLSELKGELKEVTRANHEHVARCEFLREENARLRAGPKSSRQCASSVKRSEGKRSKSIAA